MTALQFAYLVVFNRLMTP